MLYVTHTRGGHMMMVMMLLLYGMVWTVMDGWEYEFVRERNADISALKMLSCVERLLLTVALTLYVNFHRSHMREDVRSFFHSPFMAGNRKNKHQVQTTAKSRNIADGLTGWLSLRLKCHFLVSSTTLSCQVVVCKHHHHHHHRHRRHRHHGHHHQRHRQPLQSQTQIQRQVLSLWKQFRHHHHYYCYHHYRLTHTECIILF